jgi:uncharacterized protein (UPF0548 family)
MRTAIVALGLAAAVAVHVSHAATSGPAIARVWHGRVPVAKADDYAKWRTGFTYRTLVGHPELGEETFSAEKELESGRVRASLRAWSRPGTALARAFAPIARRLQLHASARALDHLERLAREPL